MKNKISKSEEAKKAEEKKFNDAVDKRVSELSLRPSKNDFGRIISVVVENSSDETKTASLFNHLNWWRRESFPDGLTVTCSQCSYDQLMLQSIQMPFLMHGMKYQVKGTEQFSELLGLDYADFTGSGEHRVLIPHSYTNSYQNVPTRLELEDFKFTKNIQAYIDVPVQAGQRITLTFYISAIIAPGKLLESLSLSSAYDSALPKQEIIMSTGRRSDTPKKPSVFSKLSSSFSKKIKSLFQKSIRVSSFSADDVNHINTCVESKEMFIADVVFYDERNKIMHEEKIPMQPAKLGNVDRHTLLTDTTDWPIGVYTVKVYKGGIVKASTKVLVFRDINSATKQSHAEEVEPEKEEEAIVGPVDETESFDEPATDNVEENTEETTEPEVTKPVDDDPLKSGRVN